MVVDVGGDESQREKIVKLWGDLIRGNQINEYSLGLMKSELSEINHHATLNALFIKINEIEHDWLLRDHPHLEHTIAAFRSQVIARAEQINNELGTTL